MASLEDTFRMMKGAEPVNTNRLTKTDKLNQEMKAKYNGNPSGKITRGFMDSVRSTLIETRGGTVSESPAAAPVEEVKKYRDGLVSAGKVLVASLKAIDFGHESKPHDLNNLIKVEDTMRQLSGHLVLFPELRKNIKGRVKFPAHPKRQQRLDIEP
jgi:hypothetical protein